MDLTKCVTFGEMDPYYNGSKLVDTGILNYDYGMYAEVSINHNHTMYYVNTISNLSAIAGITFYLGEMTFSDSNNEINFAVCFQNYKNNLYYAIEGYYDYHYNNNSYVSYDLPSYSTSDPDASAYWYSEYSLSIIYVKGAIYKVADLQDEQRVALHCDAVMINSGNYGVTSQLSFTKVVTSR